MKYLKNITAIFMALTLTVVALPINHANASEDIAVSDGNVETEEQTSVEEKNDGNVIENNIDENENADHEIVINNETNDSAEKQEEIGEVSDGNTKSEESTVPDNENVSLLLSTRLMKGKEEQTAAAQYTIIIHDSEGNDTIYDYSPDDSDDDTNSNPDNNTNSNPDNKSDDSIDVYKAYQHHKYSIEVISDDQNDKKSVTIKGTKETRTSGLSQKIEVDDMFIQGRNTVEISVGSENLVLHKKELAIDYYTDDKAPNITNVEAGENSLSSDGEISNTGDAILADKGVKFLFKPSAYDQEACSANYEYKSDLSGEYYVTYTMGDSESDKTPIKAEPCADGNYCCYFQEDGEYHINGIYTTDKVGKQSEKYSLKKDIYIDSQWAQRSNYELTNNNGWSINSEDYNNNCVPHDGWYSASLYGDNNIDVIITYYTYGWVHEPKLIRVNDKEIDVETESKNLTLFGFIKEVKAKFSVSTEVGRNELYQFTYNYFGTQENSILIPVKVDNESPKGKFRVYFTANGENYVIKLNDAEQDDKNVSYQVGVAEGKVVTNDDTLVLNLELSEVDDGTNGSGLSKMYYSYEVDGQSEDETPVDSELNGKFTAQIPVKCDENQELTYKIKTIKLEDAAGNTAEYPVEKVENTSVDKVDYEIDKKKPVIEYEDEKSEKLKESDGTLYFDRKFSRELIVTDKHLDVESVKTVSTGGLKPSIGKAKKIEGRDAYSYNLKFDSDGKYEYYVESKDIVNNLETKETAKVVIDTEVPDVSIQYSSPSGKVDSAKGAESYTNKDVDVVVTVKEANITDDGLNVQIKGTDPDGNDRSITLTNADFSRNGDVYTATYPVSVEGTYTVSASATDKCGHTKSEEAGKFILDKTPPKVVTVSFDNNKAFNESYYNAERVATVVIRDYTFDENKVDLDMTASGNTPQFGNWSGAGNDYTSTIRFTEDGKYKFRISCVDKAGNVSETYESEEFYIDRTEPKIKISFDNNSAVNTMYYKDKRTATIEIDEMSFDDSTVSIVPLTDGQIDNLPQITSFSGGNKTHTASISFNEDGRYGFSISCKDLAGNESEKVSSEVFVIDTTVPKVTISGVADKSANNGVVAPVVTYVDKNVDTQKSKITTVGKNNGDVTASATLTKIADGYKSEMADFPHDKKYDDVYVITANVFDLAGNEADEEIMFSVNRFGSVYYIDDATAAAIADYYTNKPPVVSITEVNIDELEWKNVSVGRDGDIRELKSGSDYTVSKVENDKLWKSFTYTVKSKNFNKDGKYSVVIASKDAATNEQDNVVKDKEIEFAVDMTEPGIAVSGLENNGLYEEETHLISFSTTDNMGVTGAAIYDGGKLLHEYTGDQLEKDGFAEQVELLSDDKSRDIKIVSTDVAGNESVEEFDNIIIAMNAVQVKEEEEEEEKKAVLAAKREETTDDEQKKAPIDRKTGVPVLPIAGGSTAVVVGGYAAWEFLKKKKKFK